MISIKKVEVTPIDRNIAKVVDSTSTQDDKTKNTYSMRVIDNQLDDKVDGQFLVNNYYSKNDVYNKTEVYSKGDYAIITGTLTEGTDYYEASGISLPTGFTATNTVIISAMTHNPNNEYNAWATGTIFSASSYVLGGGPLLAYINDNGLGLRMKNVQFSTGSDQTAYVGIGGAFEFKVVLMKIS